MKAILFVLAMLLSIIASTASGADTIPVVRGSSGFFAQEPVVATSVSIERALVPVLTSAQLDQIIKHDARIPLDKTTKRTGWDSTYTHLTYEDTVTKYAALDGSVIRTVEKTIVEKGGEFNPFFFIAAAYLVLVWLEFLALKSMQKRTSDAITIGGFIAFCSAAITALVAFVSVALVFRGGSITGIIAFWSAAATCIATLAVLIAGATRNMKFSFRAAVAGSMAMIMAMLLVWFV